jgi:AAA15 family ATPase/GTPase
MLLEFKSENFKSFVEEVNFSMKATPKQKGLDYSLFTLPKNVNNIKCLCSSVIYGPNAAGKTNIFGAMDTFQTIVSRGHIYNSSFDITSNVAASSLELIPNLKLQEPKPVKFYIDFIENNIRIQYSLKLDLGTFLDDKYPRKILEEALLFNEKQVFLRNDSLKINESFESSFYSFPKALDVENLTNIALKSLSPQELFLTNGFKVIFFARFGQFCNRLVCSKTDGYL